MNEVLRIARWTGSIVFLVAGTIGLISERRYSGFANSVEFFGAFLVIGLAINPIVLGSVKLVGHAYLTMIAGFVLAVALICYASWYAV